ncbi:MAG: hypothetical protein AB9917_04975 [Negativicutes bacterium]
MRGRGQQGAFLIDVLIAVCILSIGLLAVMGLFVRISQAGHQLDRLEQAVYLAEDGMERLKNDGSEAWTQESLMKEAGSESVDKNGVRFIRTITLRKRPDMDPSGHLLEAEVHVAWTENNDSPSIVLVTYFAVDTELENLR